MLLVQAGLTPLEALRSATLSPARFLNRNDVGRIAPGSIAELVLLDANPLENIRHTQQVATVIFGGGVHDKTALDAMKAAVADASK